MDKIQKIREEVERLMNELIQEKKKGFGSDADDACILELQNVLTYIDSLQEEPVSEELEEDINKEWRCYSKDNNVAYINKFSFILIARHFANWQKEKEYTCYEEAIEFGAKWKEEQFEKNRLKHCNSITNEQAELEQKFLDEHLDKYNRMPTFLDAIEYGMRLQKEQMMKKAVDADCFGFQGAALFSFRLPSDKYLIGSKVKVIVIKED